MGTPRSRRAKTDDQTIPTNRTLTGAHCLRSLHEGLSRRDAPERPTQAAARVHIVHWKRRRAVGAPKPKEERAALLSRTIEVEAVFFERGEVGRGGVEREEGVFFFFFFFFFEFFSFRRPMKRWMGFRFRGLCLWLAPGRLSLLMKASRVHESIVGVPFQWILSSDRSL